MSITQILGQKTIYGWTLKAVSCLIMKTDVQAPYLLFLGYPQAYDQINNLEDDQGHEKCKGHGGNDRDKLYPELTGIA